MISNAKQCAKFLDVRTKTHELNLSLDFGSFRCISKNSIGQAEEYIELYGKLRIFCFKRIGQFLRVHKIIQFKKNQKHNSNKRNPQRRSINSIRSNNLSLKYQMSTPSGCTDIRNKKIGVYLKATSSLLSYSQKLNHVSM